MNVRYALLAATVLGVPAVASAQPVSGLYIGAGAMANFLQTETIKHVESPYLGNVQHGSNPVFDPGWGGVASIGYGLGNGVRVEIEGDYRDNGLQSYKGAVAAGRPSGNEESYGVMANALYDFSFSDIGLSMLGLDGVNPYIGAGFGYVHSEWSGVNVPLGTGPGYSSLNVNSGYDTFAAQAIIGAAFPLYSVLPGLSLTAEYRFYAIPEDRKYTSQLIEPGIPSASSTKVGDDFSHSILVGFRYAFNVPTPPPPPAPMPVAAPTPAPARTYLVFFDWDRADLTDRAKQIIGEAAANVAKVQLTRIEVNGYTDLSGTAAYNQALSVRRARAVEGELVHDGVPQNEIDIHGYGESNPLVPTAQGVREPQNRRVEIIFK
jgi:opacity protein-like surface antigen